MPLTSFNSYGSVRFKVNSGYYNSLLIVQGIRAQLTIAGLAYPYRLQNAQTRYFRLEATALVAKDLATVAAMMLPFIQCKSE